MESTLLYILYSIVYIYIYIHIYNPLLYALYCTCLSQLTLSLLHNATFVNRRWMGKGQEAKRSHTASLRNHVCRCARGWINYHRKPRMSAIYIFCRIFDVLSL